MMIAMPARNSHEDINATIGGIDTACRGWVQRQKPGENREAQAGRNKKPCAFPLRETEVGKIAADNLGHGRQQEEQDGFDFKHGDDYLLKCVGSILALVPYQTRHSAETSVCSSIPDSNR
jgi:hypothetical protein